MNTADVRWLAEKVAKGEFFSVSDASVLALAKRVLELEQPVAHEHSPVLVEKPVDGVFKVGDRVRRWIPNYNLEHVPLMHFDPTKPSSDRTVVMVDGGRFVEVGPQVDERKVAEAYREKVLEAFRAWDMRPGDTRTWHQVVMGVDLP